MRNLDIICTVLLIIGGLNWGLWGLFQFDLVAAIFGGATSGFSRLIYTLVGIAAVYFLFSLKGLRRRWGLVGPAERPEVRRVA